MDRDDRQLARLVLAEQEQGDGAVAEPSGGRQLRHVLIPSELVTVELSLPDGEPCSLQADLINVSGGGCCLVLPGRLPLEAGSTGVLQRPGEQAGSLERRPFVVRWRQDLGEMLEIGVQYRDQP